MCGKGLVLRGFVCRGSPDHDRCRCYLLSSPVNTPVTAGSHKPALVRSSSPAPALRVRRSADGPVLGAAAATASALLRAGSVARPTALPAAGAVRASTPRHRTVTGWAKYLQLGYFFKAFDGQNTGDYRVARKK